MKYKKRNCFVEDKFLCTQVLARESIYKSIIF